MSIHYQADRGAACGSGAGECTMHIVGDRTYVTCKRCLASLAKRDREFQRKARRWVASRIVPGVSGDWRMKRAIRFDVAMRDDAARAIAREEGRPS